MVRKPVEYEKVLPAGYFLKSRGWHGISVEQAETFCEDCIDIVRNEAIVPSDEIPSSCDRCGCPIQCSLFGTFDLITTYGEWMAADEATS